MTRTLAALTAALTLAGASTAAADTFSPANATTRFVGPLTVMNGVTLTCTGALEITTDPTATAAVVSDLSLTGGLCSIISFINLPYTLDALPAAAISIQNIEASGFSRCGPDTVEVNWSSAQIITFNSVVIEPPLFCMLINGSLSRVSGPVLTIAP